MTTEIQKRDIELNGRGLALRTLEDMSRFAEGVIKAGLAPRSLDSREKLIIAMQLGQEIGLSYMISLKSIAVINGTPTIYGDAALGLVRRSGLLEDITEEINGSINGNLDNTADDVTAVCTVTRKGEKPTTRMFSVADAKRAGLWNKRGPWQTHPKRMLQYKARAFALRDTHPDVLMGLHFWEEMVGEDPKHVESTEVACRSQILLDEDNDGTEGHDGSVVQEQEQGAGEPAAGLQGGSEGSGSDVRTGGLAEDEREGGDVPEHGGQTETDEPDTGGDGRVPVAEPNSGPLADDSICICKSCKRQFPYKLRINEDIGEECPFCGNIAWDANPKAKREIWKCSKGHAFPLHEVLVTPLSRTGKCPQCEMPNITVERAS